MYAGTDGKLDYRGLRTISSELLSGEGGASGAAIERFGNLVEGIADGAYDGGTGDLGGPVRRARRASCER